MQTKSQLPLTTGTGTAPATIQERFEEFHRLNPQVYTKLVQLARDLKRKGFKRLGINCLWEVLRWHYLHEIGPTIDTSGFTLNDHYASRYARAIMQNEADLKDIFSTRTLTAK